MLKTTSSDLGKFFEENPDAYFDAFKTANFQRLNLRICAKKEIFNDQVNIKHKVISATPFSKDDYKDYIKKMIKDLDEAGVDLPEGINREKYM